MGGVADEMYVLSMFNLSFPNWIFLLLIFIVKLRCNVDIVDRVEFGVICDGW